MSSLRGTKVEAAAVEALREANAGRGSLSRLIDDEKLESISPAAETKSEYCDELSVLR